MNMRIPTIVLADRNADFRSNVAEALRALGVEVVEAASGMEVLDHVLATPLPDALVTELELGDTDALSLLQGLRITADISAQELPVVVMSYPLEETSLTPFGKHGVTIVNKMQALEGVSNALASLFPGHIRADKTRPH